MPVCSSFTDEPLGGTAATETAWLLIEHREGGWGRDVLDASGDAFGDSTDGLRELASRLGARVLAIRRPGRVIADPAHGGGPLVVMHAAAGVVRRFTIDSYSELSGLDFAAGGEPVQAPVALVCTHGKRDVCCARAGRPIAAELAKEFPHVWECSHTGGHRFAPVLIALPTGMTYGRTDPEHAREVMAAAEKGLVVADRLRGRAEYPPELQAAETAVRAAIHAELGDLPAAAVTATATADRSLVVVRSPLGEHHVRLSSEELFARPASCGAAPKPARVWRTEIE